MIIECPSCDGKVKIDKQADWKNLTGDWKIITMPGFCELCEHEVDVTIKILEVKELNS